MTVPPPVTTRPEVTVVAPAFFPMNGPRALCRTSEFCPRTFAEHTWTLDHTARLSKFRPTLLLGGLALPMSLALATMPRPMRPWAFFLAAMAGWMNRRQQEAIEFLREENRILREQLGGKRLLLSDEQTRRLAVKGKTLGRKLLRQFGTLFSAGTILKWRRMLVARKYDGSAKRRPGPFPKKANMIRDLVLRMAADNQSWGYGRIHGDIKGLGYDVHWQTVRRIMREHGLLDDPERPDKTSWKTFLRSHWDSMAACDFFTLEAWTPLGLQRALVSFFSLRSPIAHSFGRRRTTWSLTGGTYVKMLAAAEDHRNHIHDRSEF